MEEEDFPFCPFDPCLYAQCSEQAASAGTTDIRYSCAVAHSQCRAGWCLVYEGSIPFCTKACDPAVPDDCPGESTCEEYLGATGEREAVYYCVPPAVERESSVHLCDPALGGTDCPTGARCVTRTRHGAEVHQCEIGGTPVPTYDPGECDTLD